MDAFASRRNRERGQGLVEYALILVLVAVVVIVVLGLAGESVAQTMCTVVQSFDASQDCTPPAAPPEAPPAPPEPPPPSGPQEGDICVSYTFEPHPWYYIWRYHNGSWMRIPEIGGVQQTCSFSAYPNNHSRDPYI